VSSVSDPRKDRQPAAPRDRSQLWRWTKRVFIGLAGLVVVLPLAGVIYQFVATRIDEYRYPVRGELVDVGDYSLHLYCTGEGGAPTVVMDSGLGGTVLDWQLVQPEVAQFARVCTYDRAGMGWSERGGQPRTSQQVVEELHALLSNAGVEGPYVLIGHSLGGVNMQLFASHYPDEVAGMVLVDSALSDLEVLPLTESLQPSPVSIKILATIGVTRLPYTLWGETPGNTSAELKDEQAAITSHAKDVYEIADESALLEESFKQQLATPVPLGDKPLIVLTAGPLQLADTSLSEEQIEQLNEAHNRTQAALTQGSQNAEQIIAEDSGHYIQVEQPDLVIEAIRRVVEAARNGSRV
jgi:pimeloyl-ACP methyl ester carboxylesterase